MTLSAIFWLPAIVTWPTVLILPCTTVMRSEAVGFPLASGAITVEVSTLASA
jgi:hypothetical protein